ncbi:MAG: YjbH domain-containing protein [Ramlibacter sp.]|nr:YjbH domain-containing protein [Ramlibacter sp.]
MKISQLPRNRSRFLTGLVFSAAGIAASGVPGVQAQVRGISAQGTTGGLVIPSAQVLDSGVLALTAGNYQEPGLGTFRRKRNYSLGIGLMPNIELFGRFADYQNLLPGSTAITGPRDLSANVKFKLPSFWRGQPDVAVGLNDIGGGAAYFKSRYAVVSDQIGPVRWSAGYAWGSLVVGISPSRYAFDGAFGGAEWALGDSGLSLLAEYDGQQKHAGVRYASPELRILGNARLLATLQRSMGANNNAGSKADQTSVALSIMVPLEANALRPAEFKPTKALRPLESAPNASGMVPTPEDQQETLLKSLLSAGFERVRVGVWNGNLLVEYENHRYEQTEADAIGLVLGLAVENAPPGVRRVSAVTFKSGLRQYETSVDVPIYRAFLRDGDASLARTSLATDRFPDYADDEVRWLDARPTGRTPVRVEIKPDINYTVGTEVGAFDYSLAANVQGIVPLWRGAELYTSYIRRVSNSDNYEPGFAFSGSRQRNGLKVAAVQQSFWLGPQVFANLGVGRYNYDAYGVQGEASLFVPGRDDVIRLRAGAYQRQPGQTNAQRLQVSGSYRWIYSPSTWLEAGLQQYSDGTRGPSFVLTRWFGDVGAHLFFRKGGNRQFAGLEISIPLTPRKGMEPGFIQFTGTPQFQRGIRTRITGGSTATNNVEPNAVRDMQLDYNAELRQLNAGRTSQRYFISQLHRMREAFYLYGRDLLPR